jgi:hypothetical protein
VTNNQIPAGRGDVIADVTMGRVVVLERPHESTGSLPDASEPLSVRGLRTPW